jgi:hypothetical protein
MCQQTTRTSTSQVGHVLKTAFLLATFLLATHANALQVWRAGETPMLTSPQKNPSLAISLAQNESEFLIVETDHAFDFARSPDRWEAHLKPLKDEAPVEIQVSWLLGHRVTKSSWRSQAAGWVDDIVVPMGQDRLFSLPHENFPDRVRLLLEFRTRADRTKGALSKPQAFDTELVLKSVPLKADDSGSAKASTEQVSVPLKLELFRWSLPPSFALRTSIGFQPWAVFKKHGQPAKDLPLYDRYFEQAREHRIDLHKIYLEYPRASKSLLSTSALPERSFSQVWKRAQGGPSENFQMRTTDLPVPSELKEFSPETKARARAYWQSLESEARRDKSHFVYFIDEPTPERLKSLRPTLRDIHSWAPSLKLLVTSAWQSGFDSLISIWCVNLAQWDRSGFAPPDAYQRLSAKGGEFWIYVSCNSHGCTGPEDPGLPDLVMDRPAAYSRVLPWLAWRLNAKGLLYYDSVVGYDASTEAPWKDPHLFDGVGEGNLFYPCPSAACPGESFAAFPSLRLKTLRDGLEDVEILTQALGRASSPAKALRKKAEEAVRNPRSWPHDVSTLNELKREALRILDAS